MAIERDEAVVILRDVHCTLIEVVAGFGAEAPPEHNPALLLEVIVYVPEIVYVWVEA